MFSFLDHNSLLASLGAEGNYSQGIVLCFSQNPKEEKLRNGGSEGTGSLKEQL